MAYEYIFNSIGRTPNLIYLVHLTDALSYKIAMSCLRFPILALVALVGVEASANCRMTFNPYHERVLRNRFTPNVVSYKVHEIEPGWLESQGGASRGLRVIEIRTRDGRSFDERGLFRGETYDLSLGVDVTGNTKGHAYGVVKETGEGGPRWDGRLFGRKQQVTELGEWTFSDGLLIRWKKVPVENREKMIESVRKEEAITGKSCVGTLCQFLFEIGEFKPKIPNRPMFPKGLLFHLAENRLRGEDGVELVPEIYVINRDPKKVWHQLPTVWRVWRFGLPVVFNPATWGLKRFGAKKEETRDFELKASSPVDQNYVTRVQELKEGDTVRLEDGARFELGAYLGETSIDRQFAISETRAIRIPKFPPEAHPHLKFLKAYELLNELGVPTVKIHLEESNPNRYLIVERDTYDFVRGERMNLAELSRVVAQNSSDLYVKEAGEALAEFARKTFALAEILHLHPRDIVLVNGEWKLQDFGNGMRLASTELDHQHVFMEMKKFIPSPYYSLMVIAFRDERKRQKVPFFGRQGRRKALIKAHPELGHEPLGERMGTPIEEGE